VRGAETDAEIEDLIEGFNQPTYRGMRVSGGPGADLVEPVRLEWAVAQSLGLCRAGAFTVVKSSQRKNAI
jgi:hypothetical protein